MVARAAPLSLFFRLALVSLMFSCLQLTMEEDTETPRLFFFMFFPGFGQTTGVRV